MRRSKKEITGFGFNLGLDGLGRKVGGIVGKVWTDKEPDTQSHLADDFSKKGLENDEMNQQ